MRSYDLILHKEIVRLLKAESIKVVDDSMLSDTPVVVFSESNEITDNTKTYDRNIVSYTLKMWGSKNGSSVEVKELKAKVVQALTEGIYKVPGYCIDNISVENVATFKELENANSSTINHYYQSILNISYKIKEEIK